MRALIWKEWREARRAFISGLLVLVALPMLLMVLYCLARHAEWLFGLSMGLTIVLSPIIAAIWGAHVLCNDLAAAQGQFLLAQPTRPQRIVLAKALVASVLLLALVLTATAADVIGSRMARPSESLGIDGGIIAWYVSYLLGLVATFAAALLGASMFKRLIPAVLIGLVAAVFFLLGPQVWVALLSQAARVRPVERFDWTPLAGGLVAFTLTIPIFAASLILWRQPNRPAAPLRLLTWGGAATFMILTALVTRTVGSNTLVTHRQALPDVPLANLEGWFGSTGNSVYWLSLLPSWSLKTATFDAHGRILDGPRPVARLQIPNPSWATMRPYARGLELLYSRQATYLNREMELARIPLQGVDVGKIETVFHTDVRAPAWKTTETEILRVIVERSATGEAQVLLAIDPLEGHDEPAGRLVLEGYGWPNRAVIELERDTALVWNRDAYPGSPGYVYRIDIADQRAPRLISRSLPYPQPSRAISSVLPPVAERIAVFHDGKLVLAGFGGLWVYELLPDGLWKLVGSRSASILEMLAGRLPHSLDWKDDRIYEVSSAFGLVVYDASNLSRPTRIAHSGSPVLEFTVLDNGLVATVRPDLTMEMHMLPGT
jgi:hypothetical protein